MVCKALIMPQSYYIEPPRRRDIAKLLDEIMFIIPPPASVEDASYSAASLSISGGTALVILAPSSPKESMVIDLRF